MDGITDRGAARYWIPSHIRACALLPSTVLLDLQRNRYLGLGAQETRALATLAVNWPQASVQACEIEQLADQDAASFADALLEAGLLVRDAPEEPSFGCAGLQVDSALTSVGHELDTRARIRFAHVAGFMRAVAWARNAVRTRTLYSVAGEIRRCKLAAPAPFDERRAIELVAAFRKLRPHAFAARGRCLFHALSLVRFLSGYGLPATWVIGVRARPWGAHSWVQEGSLLLDASPEQVCEYTPILAV